MYIYIYSFTTYTSKTALKLIKFNLVVACVPYEFLVLFYIKDGDTFAPILPLHVLFNLYYDLFLFLC